MKSVREILKLNIDHRCKTCGLTVESSAHIFKECRVAIKFWEEVGHWWSLNRLQRENLLSGHWSARKVYAGAKLSHVWNLVIVAALWTLWLARNELTFEGKQISVNKMLHLLKLRSFQWLQVWGNMIK